MQEAEKQSPMDSVSRILVGNKSDLETRRAVSYDEGQEMADHYGVRFIETSAKVSKNVDMAFQTMAREIKTTVVPMPRGKKPADQDRKKLTGGKGVPQKKKGCC